MLQIYSKREQGFVLPCKPLRQQQIKLWRAQPTEFCLNISSTPACILCVALQIFGSDAVPILCMNKTSRKTNNIKQLNIVHEHQKRFTQSWHHNILLCPIRHLLYNLATYILVTRQRCWCLTDNHFVQKICNKWIFSKYIGLICKITEELSSRFCFIFLLVTYVVPSIIGVIIVSRVVLFIACKRR